MTGGPIQEYYGLNCVVKDGVATLSGEGNIERMLKKLSVLKVPPGVTTPMAEDLVLERQEGECTDKALHSRYRTVVGMVLHLAVCVRPVVLLGMAKLRWEQRVVETREQKEAAQDACGEN
jgi:hypothetical protein